MSQNRTLNNILNPYNNIIVQKNEQATIKPFDAYMQEMYLQKLIEQFKSATGTVNIDQNSPAFISDFNNWIATNKGIGTITFLSLLENLEISYDKKTCAEIGKGYKDSVVIPCDTTIITPYIEKLDNRFSEGKLIESAFQVYDGVPIRFEKNEIIPDTIIKPTEIDTFMTHNPSKNTNINSWLQIHNNKDYAGIILGVYGKTYDSDMDEKIKRLHRLKNLLDDFYIYEEQKIGDTYCHVLATDTEKKKRLLKVQTDNK